MNLRTSRTVALRAHVLCRRPAKAVVCRGVHQKGHALIGNAQFSSQDEGGMGCTPDVLEGGSQTGPPRLFSAVAAPLLKSMPQAAAIGIVLALGTLHGRALAASERRLAPPPPPPTTAAWAAPAPRRRAPPPTATVTHRFADFVNSAVDMQDTFTLRTVAHYRLLQLLSMPTLGKLVAVVLVATPIIVLGGYFYKRAQGCSWQEALHKSYTILNDVPGADAVQVDSPQAGLALNLVYVAGLFTFAVLLGIITDDISSAVATMREGNYPVAERGHTVVLGWNRQGIHLLRQMAMAQLQVPGGVFTQPVVVLADTDRDALLEEVRDELAGLPLEVVLRTGTPTKLEDLKRVGANLAHTLVMLRSDGDAAAADTRQAATLAALKAAGGGGARQKLVVQAPACARAREGAAIHAALLAAALAPERAAVASTSGAERLGSLMAQVAVQPGLEEVLQDLLEFEEEAAGAELYMAPATQMAGKRYGEARRCYPTATPIGVLHAGGRMVLNPPEAELLHPGDQMVFVARGQGDLAAAPQPYEVEMPQLGRKQARRLKGRNILVVSFASDTTPLLHSLREFAPRGSHVTLLCEQDNQRAMAELRQRGLGVHSLVGSPVSDQMLRRARLGGVDSVLLYGLDQLDPDAADAQAVASVLQLHSLAAREPRAHGPLSIVTSVHHPSTERVLWHSAFSLQMELGKAAKAAPRGRRGGGGAAAPVPGAAVTLHILNPKELLSGMLAQAAAEPQLNSVFEELFSQQTGAELYLRDVRGYGLPCAQPMPWKVVAEAVRACGDTAIGVMSPEAAGGGVDSVGQLRLAPGADDPLLLAPADRVVVLAHD